MGSYSFCRNDIDQDIVFYDKCDTSCDQTTCTYTTISVNHNTSSQTWSNKNGESKYLNANQNYPIRIIRNGFNDLASADFYLLTNANLISIIPNNETFYLNNQNNYVPSYISSQQLTNNFSSIDKTINNNICDIGDYASVFKVDTNNNAISITCGNNKHITNSQYANFNDNNIINGLILRIYPISFFDDFTQFVNNPKNSLIAQINEITDFSNMSNAINNLITKNFNNYMYDWSGFINVPISGNYNFILRCQDAGGNGIAYLYIDNTALNPTKNNALIIEDTNSLKIIQPLITTYQQSNGCNKRTICNQFNPPNLIGFTTKNILQSGSNNYTVGIFTNTTGQKSIILSDYSYFDILVVGGGGGGGGDLGGGGGGGQVIYKTNVLLGPGTYNIIVGNGGSGSVSTATNTNNLKDGDNGTLSSISFNNSTMINEISFSALGGGGGGNNNNNNASNGNVGANGGGGSCDQTKSSLGGIGILGGNNGANGRVTSNSYVAGGGGGANLTTGTAINKNGGNGQPVDITGKYIYYGAGGGAGTIGERAGTGGNDVNSYGGNGNSSYYVYGSTTVSIGTNENSTNHNGKLNTGSGGGGGAYNFPPLTNNNGGSGANGIVIFRYNNVQFMKQNIYSTPEPLTPSFDTLIIAEPKTGSLPSSRRRLPTELPPTVLPSILKLPTPLPPPPTISNSNYATLVNIQHTKYSYYDFAISNYINGTCDIDSTISNSITFSFDSICDILVVGAGGGGGGGSSYGGTYRYGGYGSYFTAGSGGDGGEVIYISSAIIPAGTYYVTVGGNLPPVGYATNGNNGCSSYISKSDGTILYKANGGAGGKALQNYPYGGSGLCGLNRSDDKNGGFGYDNSITGIRIQYGGGGGGGYNGETYGYGGMGYGTTGGDGGNNYNISGDSGDKKFPATGFGGGGGGGGTSNGGSNGGGRVIIRFTSSS